MDVCHGSLHEERAVHTTPSVSKYLSSLIFFHNFDHSSYSKNHASIICFTWRTLYYCRYFKFALSFYTFAIIFSIRRMVKVERKIQPRQVFRYGGSTINDAVGVEIRSIDRGWLMNGSWRVEQSALLYFEPNSASSSFNFYIPQVMSWMQRL
jgi:hypothetical protein